MIHFNHTAIDAVSIPKVVAEQLLAAPGACVKVYLYGLLRASAQPEQIAQELELPREEVVFAMDAMSAPVSLYEPVYADGGDAVCVMDQIRDDHSSDEGWLQQLALKDAISHLQPRERNILALRFCQGKTQMEVSSEIGISQAQVSRLEKNAIRSIKQEL